MTRRIPVTFALAFTAAMVVAACNGIAPSPSPSPSDLPDATAVINAATTSSQAAKSVHAQIAVDGEAAVALPIGGASGSVDLTGTTASADLDKANSAAHATFSVPGFLNLSGELIAIDGKAYLKTTLTGAQYRNIGGSTALPVDPSNTNGLLKSLGEFLLKPGVDPVKGEDVTCGSKQCYTVSVDLDPAELAPLIGTAANGLPINLAGAALQMTIRVEKDAPNRLGGLNAKITMADGNVVNADVTFSKWDEPVTVTAPSPDQIAPG